ncbi:MAG: hypothetical protein IT423_06475 [Pirellulaceae bacterium]|nr:hypothetical protein [Pirellulaceae bacterium]
MQRKIRLKCPSCQVPIELSVADEPRVTLKCPACQKMFAAKVPPPTTNVVSAEVVRPATSAAPVPPSKPTPPAPKPPAPVRAPVAQARPTVVPRPAPPSPARPIAPAAPVAPAPLDPLGDVLGGPLGGPLSSESFGTLLPNAYQPIRRRQAFPWKPLLISGGSVMGVVLLLGLGYFAWGFIADTDWSTVRVVPDSHDRLIAEMLVDSEQRAQDALASMTGEFPDTELLRAKTLEAGKTAEVLLVRAVRLGKASREQRTDFEAKNKAINDKFRPQLEAKLTELRAAGKAAGLDLSKLHELRVTPAWMEAEMMSAAASHYLTSGMFDVPEPINDVERIYYEEADIVHEYLKLLANVRSTRQSVTAAAKIDQLADRLMDLASRRCKLPNSFLERVPREYVSKDNAFDRAQRALIQRIKRDANPDEVLKDAVASFVDARERILDAANGVNEAVMRKQFSDRRAAMALVTLRGHNDLFASEPVKRDLVPKPPRVRSSLPEPDLAAITGPNGAGETVEQLTPANPFATPQSTVDEKPRVSPGAQANAQSSGNPTSGNLSTNPGATPAQPNTSPTATAMAPEVSPTAPEMMPYAPRLTPPGGFGARPWIPRDGQGLVFPNRPQGPPDGTTGSPYGPPELPAALTGPGSVRIVIENSRQDIQVLVTRLSTALRSPSYSANTQNGKSTLSLEFAGDLQQVLDLLKFGEVLAIDESQRTITIRDK